MFIGYDCNYNKFIIQYYAISYNKKGVFRSSMEQEALMLIGISVAVAFAVTIALMPYLLKKLEKLGIVGIDVNKLEKPLIPEMGGLAALIGFTVAILVIAAFVSKRIDNFELAPLIATIYVFEIACFIGVIDDFVAIGRKKKALFVAFASIPMIVYLCGTPEISTPCYNIDLSSVYWLYLFVVIPIGVTGAANAINMCAGYNGLEGGR